MHQYTRRTEERTHARTRTWQGSQQSLAMKSLLIYLRLKGNTVGDAGQCTVSLWQTERTVSSEDTAG